MPWGQRSIPWIIRALGRSMRGKGAATLVCRALGRRRENGALKGDWVPEGCSYRPGNSWGGNPTIEFPGYQTQGSGMAIQPDHKILAIAPASGASGVAFGLTRLLPNGAFDSEFGTQGRVITDMRGMDMAKRVAIQPDGKIVVSGWVWGNEQGIVRYIA
ncbi:delta-60 repeat domain-containing protein [Pseudomonas thivervalensis]|uniref:delta-60 repeat domain-containing protein n=1 Tax=Pseudomonas thivervalensis TaxID=86265 RepID=UPI003D6BB5EB